MNVTFLAGEVDGGFVAAGHCFGVSVGAGEAEGGEDSAVAFFSCVVE